MDTEPSRDVQESALKMASQSEVLRNRINSVSGQEVSIREKNIKDVLFSTLGFSLIPTSLFKESSESLEASRVSEKQEAHDKIMVCMGMQQGPLRSGDWQNSVTSAPRKQLNMLCL